MDIPMPWSKKPTILVVDDERSVRQLVSIYLESAGYEVHQANGGREALKVATAPDVMVDILVADIIMPFMNGGDLANRICSIKPNLKVLFMSAYSVEILSGQNLCPPGADYIRKPFTKELLLERITRVWAESPKWKALVAKPA
jgi:two-component system, cell cycle sensor histidine kinase and response regulator CckA